KLLSPDYSLRENPDIFFAGQITGVEGYIESAASGIMAGINAVKRIKGEEPLILPPETMIGALTAYISGGCSGEFQPMGCNMGILPDLPVRIKDKKQKYAAYADRAIEALDITLKKS
ncbi:MAG: FAD-dependent oxidoreductase, partial [Porcipelethomonas sp.]